MEKLTQGDYLRMPEAWRQFEQLVAHIEKTLAPEGAIVTSPDRVPDKITGSTREVDATIRYTIGSVPILLTIECRDRTGIEDSTWIEQLATKQRDIGAAKTIAVSSAGFSQPAVEKAAFYGIELRRMDEITEEVIAQWTDDIVFDVVYVETSKPSFNLLLTDSEGSPDPVIDPSIPDGFREDPGRAPLIFDSETHAARSLNDFLVDLQKSGALDQGVELDGPPVRKEFHIPLRPGMCYTKTNQGPRSVLELGIRINVALRTERLSWDKVLQYSDTRAEIVQVAKARWQTAPGEGYDFIAIRDVRPGGKNGMMEGEV